MNSIAIIGGGITGLVAAWRLRQRGFSVTLYEARERVGGLIGSVRKHGYLAESGPNTIVEASPVVAGLVRELGLEQRRLYTDPAAKSRYVVRKKRPIKAPESPAGLVSSQLLSPGGKVRMLAEPFISSAPESKEENVAQFVERRFGREFLEYGLEALVSNIYPGDPEQLSVPEAYPELREAERQMHSALRAPVSPFRTPPSATGSSANFSFDEGLQVLTDTLAAKLRPVLRFSSPVTKVAQKEFGWAVTTRVGDCELHQGHCAVLYAGPAYRLPEIEVASERYVNWSSFAEMQHPPLASVVLGFRREDVAHALDGFGMVVPRVEGLRILATIFSSSIFPNRAPAGHVTLTSFLGGVRWPEIAQRDSCELVGLACAELGELLGIKGEPTFEHVTILPKALPQYEAGFSRFQTLIDQIETKAPRLFLGGNYRAGISLAHAIVSAEAAAERVENCVRADGNGAGIWVRQQHKGLMRERDA